VCLTTLQLLSLFAILLVAYLLIFEPPGILLRYVGSPFGILWPILTFSMLLLAIAQKTRHRIKNTTPTKPDNIFFTLSLINTILLIATLLFL